MRKLTHTEIAKKRQQLDAIEGAHRLPVTVVVDEKGVHCAMPLHVRDLPVYDFREALRPPTRFLPVEEEEYEEEG